MDRALIEYLACPICGSDFHHTSTASDGPNIITGTLDCAGCDASFPVTAGIPRLNASMEGLENVARTFGYEWKVHHAGQLEDDTLYGHTLEEDWKYFLDTLMVPESRVGGSTVLDAGCGSGRFTRQIAEHGAAVVLGVDLNEAVDEASAYCRHLPNVHIVQANLLALPFKRHIFDLVWCRGVLHHTPDAAKGHRFLSQSVKPGGVMYVWVYAKRFNPFRLTKDILDYLRVTELPPRFLLLLSKGFAYVSLVFLWIYRLVRKLPGLRPRGSWAKRTVRPRGRRELYLTWFDALSPEHDSRHTEEEVIGWFRREGFTDIKAIEEPKVGVRGVAPRLPKPWTAAAPATAERGGRDPVPEVR
jgi:SAM-dependent methyltransferase